MTCSEVSPILIRLPSLGCRFVTHHQFLLCCPWQEIRVPVGGIWAARRRHKINDEDVVRELLGSRDRGAVAALNDVEILSKHARTLHMGVEISRAQKVSKKRLRGFVLLPGFTEFLQQFDDFRYGVDCRQKCLLLIGDSQQGKSYKAVSLFDQDQTLKVSCQGLPFGVLPSPGREDRDKHRAIDQDVIRVDLVLNNR